MPEDSKLQNIGNGVGATSVYESTLREIYIRKDAAILKEANIMLKNGLNPSQVAEWANGARNYAKEVIRKFDFDAIRLLAEKRNLETYLNRVGPSYQQLKQGWTDMKGKYHPPKTDAQIIQSAGKSNIEVNKSSFRLKIAGGILILFDIGIAGCKVYEEKVNRPKVLLEESSALLGAMAGGIAGAKTCGFVLSYTGNPVIVGLGALGCGVGGSIYGGIWGRDLGELLADKLYPINDTSIEHLP
jgi:hypothetical protein